MIISRLSGFSSPMQLGSPDSGGSNGFISRWDTTQAGSANDTIILPLYSTGTYNFDVDWGDSTSDTITTYNQAEITHQYAASGTYTVTINGVIIGWRFYNSGDKNKLMEIQNWGVFSSNTPGAFYGCSNLTITASDGPIFISSNQSNFLRACSNIGNINVSNWDMSNVTNISYFFMQSNFGGDLSSWSSIKFTNIIGLFWANAFFNNDSLSDWDVSGVNSLSQVFYNTVFNGDISNWDTSNVTNMNSVFYGSSYNGDLSGWDFSSVTTANSMFRSCPFNNDSISGWTTSSLLNAASMFQQNTNFNQDIGGWDMSNVSNMSSMLRQTVFNQDISLWDVSNVQNMSYLFFACSDFNQDISGWTVSSVTNMTWTFRGALSFDQDISSWDINQVTGFSLFMHDVTLSTLNYDTLLIAWEAQAPTYTGGISFGGSQYTLGSLAEGAKNSLTATYSWTITDGGGI